MLGLIVLSLTMFMIFTLVKNALMGKQLSQDDDYTGTISLIIPMTNRSEFYLDPWLQSLTSFRRLTENFQIHILIDGHHPAVVAWRELEEKLPYVKIHSFLHRPKNASPTTWMIEQIAPEIKTQVVIIGDSELVPSESALLSVSKFVDLKARSYFVVPQTVRKTYLGESVALLNPTLALVSVFGWRKFIRRFAYPLMSIAQGWMAMPLETFQGIDFQKFDQRSWKDAIARDWDSRGKKFALAFGERHLRRHYPEVLKVQMGQLKIYWEELWAGGDRHGFWLFILAIFVWSFPLIFIWSHPFWSLASIFLLTLYRFFSKIIFQESWFGIMLHPFGCLIWITTLLIWAIQGVKTRYVSAPVRR